MQAAGKSKEEKKREMASNSSDIFGKYVAFGKMQVMRRQPSGVAITAYTG